MTFCNLSSVDLNPSPCWPQILPRTRSESCGRKLARCLPNLNSFTFFFGVNCESTICESVKRRSPIGPGVGVQLVSVGRRSAMKRNHGRYKSPTTKRSVLTLIYSCNNCTRLGLHCEAFDAFQMVQPDDIHRKRRRRSSAHANAEASASASTALSPRPDPAFESDSSPIIHSNSPNRANAEGTSYGNMDTVNISELSNTTLDLAPSSIIGAEGVHCNYSSMQINDINGDFLFSAPPAWDYNPTLADCTGFLGEDSPVTDTSTPWLSDHHLLSTYPAISQTEVFLLQHYFDRLCAILVNVDSPANPLKSVLIPRALTSPVLLHAVCAVSACHFANTLTDFGHDARRVSISLYTKAVQELNQVLTEARSQNSPDASSSDIFLLTAVFVCKYQITKGSVSKWRPLLTGVQQMLDVYKDSVASETRLYVQSL